MGFDRKRFKQSDLKAQYICSICSDVFEDPVERPSCEHYFCRQCVTSWLKLRSVCPIDWEPLTSEGLKDAPRLLRDLLNDLDINCEFASVGCQMVVKLNRIEDHVFNCDYNRMDCEKGCGCRLKRREKESHSCLLFLKGLIIKSVDEIKVLTRKDEDSQKKIKGLETEVKKLEVEVKQFPGPSSSTSSSSSAFSSSFHSFLSSTCAQKRSSVQSLVSLKRLKSDPKTISERVVDIMESINCRHFFIEKVVPKKVIELRCNQWAPYLKGGENVLYVENPFSAYEWVILAQMVGQSGHVTVTDPQEEDVVKVKTYHEDLMISGRIKFVASEGDIGYPAGAPFDVIRTSLELETNSRHEQLMDQLKVGGVLFIYHNVYRKQEDASRLLPNEGVKTQGKAQVQMSSVLPSLEVNTNEAEDSVTLGSPDADRTEAAIARVECSNAMVLGPSLVANLAETLNPVPEINSSGDLRRSGQEFETSSGDHREKRFKDCEESHRSSGEAGHQQASQGSGDTLVASPVTLENVREEEVQKWSGLPPLGANETENTTKQLEEPIPVALEQTQEQHLIPVPETSSCRASAGVMVASSAKATEKELEDGLNPENRKALSSLQLEPSLTEVSLGQRFAPVPVFNLSLASRMSGWINELLAVYPSSIGSVRDAPGDKQAVENVEEAQKLSNLPSLEAKLTGFNRELLKGPNPMALKPSLDRQLLPAPEINSITASGHEAVTASPTTPGDNCEAEAFVQQEGKGLKKKLNPVGKPFFSLQLEVSSNEVSTKRSSEGPKPFVFGPFREDT